MSLPNKNMLNLYPMVDLDALDKIRHRGIMDITESRIGSERVLWKGSTENEYFSIVFMSGILSVSVAERECQLGLPEFILCVGISKKSREKMAVANKMDVNEMVKSAYDYLLTDYIEEVKTISFVNDVLPILKWDRCDKTKTHIDCLC